MVSNINSNQSSSFWIQIATIEHSDSIAKMVNESFHAKGRGFYRIPHSSRIEVKDLQNKIQDTTKYRVFTCLRKDDQGIPEVIGASYLDIEHHEFCMFAVTVGVEKQGIGSALLEHVEKCAKDQLKLSEIVLDIVNDTRELYLKNYYEKRGYCYNGVGLATDPKQFQYKGGEKIINDPLAENLDSDTIPLVLFKKLL